MDVLARHALGAQESQRVAPNIARATLGGDGDLSSKRLSCEGLQRLHFAGCHFAARKSTTPQQKAWRQTAMECQGLA
eukprot:14998410-Alexandrium_andersonii.AAC.1